MCLPTPARCWPQHSYPTTCTSSGYPGVVPVELWSPACIHIKLLLVFTPLFVHVLQSKTLFPSFRSQIGWFSLSEQLLKIVFYLHCSVGGPLHHYLLPADDRMIGFLLGFSMVLLAKCYWKYSSKILFFFFFFLRICWFFNIYIVWRVEVRFFSPTFGRVGFSSQIEISLFRFWHASVSRQAEYLSSATCTIGGAYRAMAHLGTCSLLFLISLRTL